MTELLHVAALLPAALGVCCTAGRRRGTPQLAAAIVMLVVMADLALGVVSVPPVVWTAVLVATALAVVIAARSPARRPHPTPHPRGTGGRTVTAAVARTHIRTGMTVTTAAGALVMAGLAALMAGPAPEGLSAAAASSPGGDHHVAMGLGGLLPAAVLLAAAVYTGVVARGVVRAARERRGRLEVAELASMATSVALMALAVLAP